MTSIFQKHLVTHTLVLVPDIVHIFHSVLLAWTFIVEFKIHHRYFSVAREEICGITLGLIMCFLSPTSQQPPSLLSRSDGIQQKQATLMRN